MTYRKKLIEVALPLEAINAASAREKSIRHGHPSTLHLWWARRPLAACRAGADTVTATRNETDRDQLSRPVHPGDCGSRRRTVSIGAVCSKAI